MPKMPKTDKVYTLYLDESEHADLKKRTADLGVSVNNYLRSMLGYQLRRRGDNGRGANSRFKKP
jgi:hypothetical protein